MNFRYVWLVAGTLVAACAGDDSAPAPDAAADTTVAADSSVDAPAEITAPDDAAAAIETLRRYYAAIEAKQYSDADALWRDDGTASGQSLDEFSAGFAETARVTIEPGTPGRIEGAAGSRFIDIPVAITATTTNGATQRFIGSYMLQRSVVDGATAAQRTWRIYSASIVNLDTTS